MDTLSQMAACELAFNALISQLTYFTQKPNPLSQLGRTPFSKVETFIPFIDEARHLVAGTNSPQLNQQSHLSMLFEQIKVNDKENSGLSALSLDQIKIGQNLATRKRIIISQDKGGIYANEQTHTLQMMIFGYRVFFTENEQESGKFGLPIQEILRFWDFELPSKTNESI
ncbi:TPA: hypothetical protein ACU21S_000046 [Mannheimia haemolytica]